MKIAIITSVSAESSRQLAEHLALNGIQAKVFKPYEDNRTNFRDFDCVFSYGCSADTVHNHRINSRAAVLKCIDKFLTFSAFHKSGVPTVRAWKDSRDVPPDVTDLVLRKDPKGRKAEGLTYWSWGEAREIPVGMGLYSEWYDHRRELRVTVFMDKVWVYRKDWVDGVHEFNLTTSSVYGSIRADALRAAKAIGIDYASFDVLYNSRNEYRFLEANSGSILTEEVSTAIVEHFLNWK